MASDRQLQLPPTVKLVAARAAGVVLVTPLAVLFLACLAKGLSDPKISWNAALLSGVAFLVLFAGLLLIACVLATICWTAVWLFSYKPEDDRA